MGEQYAYIQVADDVARRIDAGEITSKLPAERELAEEYGVAYTTVRHAMQTATGTRRDHHQTRPGHVRQAAVDHLDAYRWVRWPLTC